MLLNSMCIAENNWNLKKFINLSFDINQLWKLLNRIWKLKKPLTAVDSYVTRTSRNIHELYISISTVHIFGHVYNQYHRFDWNGMFSYKSKSNNPNINYKFKQVFDKM